MPIPRGASQVPGSPNRVRLSSGEVVTRATARTLGAQEQGYKNERDRSKHSAGDANYYAAWSQTAQGKHALQTAKDRAKANGEKFKLANFKGELIAARNSRPHGGRNGKPGSPPGKAWLDFMETYDMTTDEWVDSE